MRVPPIYIRPAVGFKGACHYVEACAQLLDLRVQFGAGGRRMMSRMPGPCTGKRPGMRTRWIAEPYTAATNEQYRGLHLPCVKA